MRRLLKGCIVAITMAWLGYVPTARALQPDKAFDHYVVNTWSIEDGLPQITAICLAQGPAGYIWVGTQSGVARFDGVRFVNYTPETEPALPGIWVRSLLSDRRGRLWIGTYKGLTLYQQGRFRAIPASDAARYPTPDINALVEQSNGIVLAATSDGLFRFSEDTLQKGTLQPIPGPQPALSLLTDGDGVWVGSVGAVEQFDSGVRRRYVLPGDAASAAVSRLALVNGRIWAGTSQGLFVLADGRWQALQADSQFDHSPVTAMLNDRDGNLWVGSNAGLARFRNGALAEFVPDSNPRAFRQVISAMEDREGNLWLGSQLNGLARVWNGWTRRYSEGEGLHDRVVWSLSPDPDGKRIWVGTNDGLSILQDGRFKLVVPGKDLPHPQAYNLLAEHDSSGPGQTGHDQVWIGTRRGLVLWRDGRPQTPAPLQKALASAQINGIVRAGDGSLWVTSSDGLFHWQGEQLKRYGQAEGLRDPRVRVVRFARDGRILLGTQDGLFELRDGRALALGLGEGLPPHLDVSALYELQDGRLVIGTLGDKTFVGAGHRWHALGPEQGLPANSPFFIDQDPRGSLWVAGIRGITRVPVADLPNASTTGDVHVRGEMVLNERGDANAGQQGYCCNGAGMSKGFLRDGVLWLPSRDGVVALDTAAIIKNAQPPTLVIERVRTPAGWRNLAPGTRQLQLPASARDLGFEFTALSFQDPRSVQLRYRLLGYDNGWHHLEDARRRSANYTNLPPGDYAFAVIGANNAGVWSPHPAILHFNIAPLFHETWLFRLLLAGLLAMLLYAGYRYQLQRHERQRLQLEAEVHARTLELNAANARLEKASQTDPLTGLRNRRYLANQIPADLAYYDRETNRIGDYGQVVVFALVDIDFFKRVNDTHGHRAGDHVLQQFAQVLAALVRTGDYLARWGGEEFLLVFRPMNSQHLSMIGDRIRAAVAGHRFQIDNTVLEVTCSIGLAGYPLFNVERQPGWEQMVDLADAALYWVKRHGRDGWAAFEPAPDSDAAALLQDLHEDVEHLVASGRVKVLGSLRDTGGA